MPACSTRSNSTAAAPVRAVAGRSYHLSGDNAFARGTGLNTDESDYVTGLYFAPDNDVRLIAQGRFDSDTFDLVREDVTLKARYGPVAGSVGYAFDRTTDQVGDRRQDQEVQSALSLQLADYWTAFGALRYDIDGSQLISDSLGLRYADECFSLSVTYSETYIRDRDLEPDQSVMVKFELKHLGGTSFKTDKIGSLGGAVEDQATD
ncbi:MAG: LPS assembly protein LptD [Hyphomicrobiaceae bacterium]